MFVKFLMNFVFLCVCVCVGEVTAEELRQRLDGAKERVSSQPRPESRPQNSEEGQEGSSGELEGSYQQVFGSIKFRYIYGSCSCCVSCKNNILKKKKKQHNPD